MFSTFLILSGFIVSLFDYFFLASAVTIIRVGNNTAETSEMFYLYFTVHSQADIFNHLSGIQFCNEHTFHFISVSGNGFCRERP